MKNHYEKYGRKCYLKNKEKYLPVRKEWERNNRSKRVKITQAYVQRNKEKVANYNQQFQKTVRGAFRTYKHSAKHKGFDFELSFEDFTIIVLLPCNYCGETKNRRGIDRVDNTKGYTKENSAPCCSVCNYMKKNHTREEFLTHIKKIYLHNGKQ